jgi:spore maturation protein CgeB
MKVLTCNPDGGAFSYILSGLINALNVSGIHASRNTTKIVPDDFDLYFGCSGWRQQIPKKRKGKVGIHVNPFGKTKIGSIDGGPMIDESKDAIQWVIAQKPDFLFCYCTKTFIPEYYGYWTDRYGIPVLPFPTAADITMYKPHKPEDKFKCDIGWVGGKWPYKAIMLNKYITPLMSKYKCNVYGWANTWKTNKSISDYDVPKLFSSAKICPSVSESHTFYHPIDVPERVFKVPAAGGFTIHTYSPALKDMFGDTIQSASNQDEWFNKIDYYINNETVRIEHAKAQRNTILSQHTYFDRASILIPELKNTILEFKNKYIYASQIVI